MRRIKKRETQLYYFGAISRLALYATDLTNQYYLPIPKQPLTDTVRGCRPDIYKICGIYKPQILFFSGAHGAERTVSIRNMCVEGDAFCFSPAH